MALKLEAVRQMADELGYTIERPTIAQSLPMYEVWDPNDHYLGRLTMRGLRLLMEAVSTTR